MGTVNILAPFERGPTDNRWAVVFQTNPLSIITEDGDIYSGPAAGFPDDYVIYSLVPAKDLVQEFGYDCTGKVWRSSGKRNSMHFARIGAILKDGHQFRPLMVSSEHVTAGEAYETMSWFANWVRRNGAGMGSMGTIAKNLFRATLTEEIPAPHIKMLRYKDAIYGGRKDSRVIGKELHNVRYIDLPAAYPNALHSAPVAVKVTLTRKPDLSREGIGKFKVVIPNIEADWYPLPYRVPMWGTIWGYAETPVTGIWTYEDIRRLLAWGGQIVSTGECMEIVESATGVFDKWYAVMQEGRELPGLSGKMAKSVSNKLWGIFAAKGQNGIRTWSGKGPRAIDQYDNVIQPGRRPDIAAFTDSGVREKTWPAMDEDAHYWDTDGGIVDGDHVPPGFIVKRELAIVQIASAQMHRFIVRGDDKWKVSCAGIPAKDAMRFFEDGRWNGALHSRPAEVEPRDILWYLDRERRKFEQQSEYARVRQMWDEGGNTHGSGRKRTAESRI